MKLNGSISCDRVCELFSYDPETGNFVRLKSRQSRWVGTIAGSTDSKGGRQIAINGKLYMAHRLAWLVMTGDWPTLDVDHRDGNPANNAWLNLRLATESQNIANGKKPKNNTSGFKGAHLERATGRWNSHIVVHGVQKYLGTFDTAEQANAAYAAAAALYFGEFARAA